MIKRVHFTDDRPASEKQVAWVSDLLHKLTSEVVAESEPRATELLAVQKLLAVPTDLTAWEASGLLNINSPLRNEFFHLKGFVIRLDQASKGRLGGAKFSSGKPDVDGALLAFAPACEYIAALHSPAAS